MGTKEGETVKTTGTPAQDAHPRGRGTAWVGELGSLMEITLEPHPEVPIHLPVSPRSHLRKPDTQASSRASISNTNLPYSGIQVIHLSIILRHSNSPAQVHTGKIYLKFKYYSNRLLSVRVL